MLIAGFYTRTRSCEGICAVFFLIQTNTTRNNIMQIQDVSRAIVFAPCVHTPCLSRTYCADICFPFIFISFFPVRLYDEIKNFKFIIWRDEEWRKTAASNGICWYENGTKNYIIFKRLTASSGCDDVFLFKRSQTEKKTNYANQKKSLWNFCIWSSPFLCDRKTLKLDEKGTEKSSRILLLNIFVLMKFKIKRNE